MKNHPNRLAQKIAFLEDPEKRGDLPPKQLFDLIPIQQSDNFLDLGAGTGYFTIPAAKMVDGTVYAVDIDCEMLEIIKTKAHDEKLTNIETIEGNFSPIPLPDHAVNIALASLVLHEVKPLNETLTEIHRVLKDGGHFVCVEIEKKDNSPDGPPRIHFSVMEQELLKAGFTIQDKLIPTTHIYIFIVQK
ncbi:class I SAM-dependent methyltransferase [Sporosarcina ureilytica]|uniref:SAM-dependent methyltransferase n=1 Tax=Sporosarcina ureilytica TaxID=298596 RepID=A0A1D8JDS4_9BACL|nr:class I SAM-dependent methyltransferase [Sporosarcina ureilytica]AOV06862.1 SAM-dependent methyltransferase [Sporosarcina ureilytica]